MRRHAATLLLLCACADGDVERFASAPNAHSLFADADGVYWGDHRGFARVDGWLEGLGAGYDDAVIGPDGIWFTAWDEGWRLRHLSTRDGSLATDDIAWRLGLRFRVGERGVVAFQGNEVIRDGQTFATLPEPIVDLRLARGRAYAMTSEGLYQIDLSSGDVLNVFLRRGDRSHFEISGSTAMWVDFNGERLVVRFDLVSGVRLPVPSELEALHPLFVVANSRGDFLFADLERLVELRSDGTIRRSHSIDVPIVLVAADDDSFYYVTGIDWPKRQIERFPR